MWSDYETKYNNTVYHFGTRARCTLVDVALDECLSTSGFVNDFGGDLLLWLPSGSYYLTGLQSFYSNAAK